MGIGFAAMLLGASLSCGGASSPNAIVLAHPKSAIRDKGKDNLEPKNVDGKVFYVVDFEIAEVVCGEFGRDHIKVPVLAHQKEYIFFYKSFAIGIDRKTDLGSIISPSSEIICLGQGKFNLIRETYELREANGTLSEENCLKL